jgi:2-hydroxy-3-keto-5-methylthiopentenyl-1-phosphate phosphatase
MATDPSSPAPTVPVPPLRDGDPPLAILVDYDGTIAKTDVSDALMARYVTQEWEARAAEYDAGLIGSRRLMEWEVGLITASPDELRAEAAAQPHDVGFVDLVRRATEAGIPVEVVSDGFGFFIPAALAALGMPEVPVITASTTFRRSGTPRIEFPNGHPRCFVCGTCKRNRVLAHQAAGRAVAFIGDGESDRYAAGYSDVVFAKRALVRLCLDNGWPFQRWTEFSEIDTWLGSMLAAWRDDPGVLPRPTTRPFFCGPEVWGEGRWDPPAPQPSAYVEDEGLVPG